MLDRSIQNGCDDLAISRAPAEHATDRIEHVVLARGWVFLQQSGRGHQHSWSARSALRGAIGQKPLL
jgi:hypothetical protein